MSNWFKKIKKQFKKSIVPQIPDDIPEFDMWDGTDLKAAKKAAKKISAARVKATQAAPFFGHMTLLLIPRAEASVPTMATDGEYLYYNPHFVNKALNKEELAGVICHEVLHCVLLHLWRKGKRHQFKWNMACDYAVNPIVREQGLTLPTGTLLDHNYNDLSAEQIYEKLPKLKKMKASGDWFSDKSKWGKKKRDKEDGDSKKKSSEKQSKDSQSTGKGKQSKSKQQSSKTDSKGTSQSSKDSTRQKWEDKKQELDKAMDKIRKNGKTGGKKGSQGESLEDFWEGIFTSAVRGNTAGKLPGYLERVWREMQPKQDWRKILANYLSRSNDDFNFSTPDRRYLEADFFLPDIYEEQTIEDVVIAIDTSGSISTWQFNHFMSEVKEILSVFPHFKGHLIQCDWDIQRVDEISNEEEFDPKFRGGGGTSFQPVFDYIEKKDLNPRLVVYLTDGYGSFPDKEPSYPTLWLIDSQVEPPWGERIQYEYDEGDELSS